MTPERSTTIAKAQATFDWLWLGQLLSNLGTQSSLYGMGLWMFQRQGRVADFAVVALVVQVARILALPLLGRRLQSWPRRLVLVIANGIGGVCTLALTALLLNADPSIGLGPVLLLQALAAMAEAALVLSVSSLIPCLLPSGPALARANGRFASSEGIAASLAPFLGSWLVGTSGLKGVFLVDATTFAIAFACVVAAPWPLQVLTMHRHPQQVMEPLQPTHWWQVDLAPRLRRLALVSASIALVYAVTEILYPPWVTVSFGAERMGTVLVVGLLSYGLGLSWWHGVGARKTHGSLRLGLGVQGLVLVGLCWPGVPDHPWLWIGGQAMFSAMLPINLAVLQGHWCASAPSNQLAPVMALRYGCDWIARVSGFALCSVAVDRLVTPALTLRTWPIWLHGWLEGGQQRALALVMALAGTLLLLNAGLQPTARLGREPS
jgi:hypothetical protein